MSSILNPNTILFTNKLSQRAIGEFTGYVCIGEESDDELKTTKEPVQRGSEITDHAFKSPPTVVIKFIYTSTLTTSLEETYAALLELQASRQPFSIVTGKRVYDSMLCLRFRVTTDVSKENILYIIGHFEEIEIVDTQETNVPPRSHQQIPEKTDVIENKGDKKAESVAESQTTLKVISQSFGGVF